MKNGLINESRTPFNGFHVAASLICIITFPLRIEKEWHGTIFLSELPGAPF